MAAKPGFASVDPRGCGGASPSLPCSIAHSGRSPRVRGSHRRLLTWRTRYGSIPAGAGEPGMCEQSHLLKRVDPRGCGGATNAVPYVAVAGGRSPRVRGSQPLMVNTHRGLGSIPAGAGEPSCRAGPTPACRVDPRGCGGALRNGPTPKRAFGRSPRVRGSLDALRALWRRYGSIPAGAGEPAFGKRRRNLRRVDPRGCGGAVVIEPTGWREGGRSPRVRGSPGRAPAFG